MSTIAGLSKLWRRFVCLGVLIAMAPFSLSCYGHFPLTHAVYRMNGEVGGSVGEDRTQHKIVQSVIFWVLWIIPVYWVAILADAIVLNLIEFWTGDTVSISSVQEHDGTRVALQSTPDGHAVVMTVSRNGKFIDEQRITKVSPTSFEMRNASGKLTGTVHKTPEGNIQLLDAQNRIIRTLAANDLAALARN